MDPATIRFRFALPFALFPFAPPLAALHATRARTLHPDYVSPDRIPCSHCGSLLIHHLRAFKNKKHNRFICMTCRICGAVTLNPLPTPPFPPTRTHGTTTTIQPPTTEIENSSPLSPPSPQKHQSRLKKKSGLQLLLARNRENEEREHQKQKQTNSSQLGGLAAFLSDLS